MIWWAVILAALGCYLLKYAGLSLPQRVLEHPTVERTATYLPVVMLAALVLVEVADGGGRLQVDLHLLVGVGAAVVALLLRQSFLVVIVAAAVTTAVLRMVF